MSEWRETSIDEVAAPGAYAVVGGPFGSALGRKDYLPTGVPVIRGAQLGGPGAFLEEDFVFVSEEKADRHPGNLAYPGDIIVTQRGTVGQVGRIPDKALYARYLLSQSQMKLTVDPAKADSRFIHYLLLAPDAQERLHGATMSAGVPHINLTTFRNLKLRLPSVTLQTLIARVLGSIDDLIQNNGRRIEFLEQMTQAIYREWFVHFRYPGHENATFVDSPLGAIPAGWHVRNLGHLALNFDRLRQPLSKSNREERRGPFPYYGAAKLIDWVDDWIFDGEYLLFAEDGTVQTAAGFPVLQLVEGRFWANNHTHILQGSGVSTRYLYLSCSAQSIIGLVTGAAQPKITQGNLNRLLLVTGPLSLHEAFGRVTDPLFDQCRLLQAQRSALTSIRDLLLPKLLTGEIDVLTLDLGAVA